MGRQTVYIARIGGEEFICKGLAIHEYNFLEIYTYEKWSGAKVPVLRPGQTFVPSDLLLVEGQTTAPNLLTVRLVWNRVSSQNMGLTVSCGLDRKRN